MSLTNTYENEVLDHILRTGAYNSTFTSSAQLYVGLFTSDPGEAGGGTEVSGGSYTRVQVTGFDAASGGSASNSAAITWTTATANWGDVSHIGIFESSGGSDMVIYAALDTTKTVNNGDTFTISSGNLTITLN